MRERAGWAVLIMLYKYNIITQLTCLYYTIDHISILSNFQREEQ